MALRCRPRDPNLFAFALRLRRAYLSGKVGRLRDDVGALPCCSCSAALGHISATWECLEPLGSYAYPIYDTSIACIASKASNVFQARLPYVPYIFSSKCLCLCLPEALIIQGTVSTLYCAQLCSAEQRRRRTAMSEAAHFGPVAHLRIAIRMSLSGPRLSKVCSPCFRIKLWQKKLPPHQGRLVNQTWQL